MKTPRKKKKKGTAKKKQVSLLTRLLKGKKGKAEKGASGAPRENAQEKPLTPMDRSIRARPSSRMG